MPLLVLLFPFQLQTATVTIEDAVGAALGRHPDVVAAGAQIDVARAQARQARAPLLPQVDMSGRYACARSAASAGSAGDAGSSSGDSFSASLSAGMLLWDFGQSRNRWRAALAVSDAAKGDANTVREAIVLEARLAFLDA